MVGCYRFRCWRLEFRNNKPLALGMSSLAYPIPVGVLRKMWSKVLGRVLEIGVCIVSFFTLNMSAPAISAKKVSHYAEGAIHNNVRCGYLPEHIKIIMIIKAKR